MPIVTPAVEASGLELRYGSRVVLAASDFEIPAGSVTAVIGPNGSGKSTLLAAVAGLLKPTAGRLSVLGGEPDSVRSRVAFVLQSTKVNEVLPVTVREVVAMGRYSSLGLLGRFGRPDREAVERDMRRLELDELAGRHLTELSGGQRQRVFVAQGLVQEHDLLLMDEPLTGLDLVSAAVIEAVMAEEKERGVAVVVTTHDLEDAARADQVLLLAGRVIASGPPEQVLVGEHLASAYRSQLIDPSLPRLLDDAAHRPADRRHVHIDLGSTTHRHG